MPNRNAELDQMVAAFSTLWGTNAGRLQGWQDLCHDCGVPVGPSITQCKKTLQAVHINISDLVDARLAGTCPPRHFANRKALVAYTVATHRFFPKKKAKENGFLRALLVTLHGR